MTSRVLTAVAWPYANGPRHIGHVSGFGVPSDVFSRFMRMSGHDVLMVSGTDEHGTPILVQAEQRGTDARASWRTSTTGSSSRTCRASGCRTTCSPGPPPATTTRWCRSCSSGLHRNGYVVPKTAMGAVSPSTGRTLPDRYIEGTCPICGYPSARGDQCDNCGNQLDPIDLINPRVADQRRDAQVRRDRALLPRPAGAGGFARRSGSAIGTDWRPNVLKFSQNLLEDLRPRAITRDLDWGVPVPLDGWRDQPMKRLYVWFDAVIGYLSASVEWAAADRRPGRLAAVVDRPGRARLLLHGQGQHRLPHRDLARHPARPQRRGRPRRHGRTARRASAAGRDRVE